MNALYSIGHLEHGYNGIPVLELDPCVIKQGSVHALIGPNGTGKSTLLNLLAFTVMPNKGKISFLGDQVETHTLAKFRKRVGYVQQNPYLFNLTVSENIQLGLKYRGINKQLRESRADHIIEQFEIENLANKKPNELSGGEAQKVAIARTLVLEPEVLILDEPFTFLDKDFSLMLENIIYKIRESGTRTLIFSIHDFLRAQRLADQVWTLHNNKLIHEAPVNIFSGNLNKDKNLFDTGKLKIVVPEEFDECDNIAIEAIHIVVSRSNIHTSMRNTFVGRIYSIDDYDHNLIVKIDAGEIFTATITRSAQKELDLSTGDTVWASFKSTAIRVVR